MKYETLLWKISGQFWEIETKLKPNTENSSQILAESDFSESTCYVSSSPNDPLFGSVGSERRWPEKWHVPIYTQLSTQNSAWCRAEGEQCVGSTFIVCHMPTKGVYSREAGGEGKPCSPDQNANFIVTEEERREMCMLGGGQLW